MRADGGHLNQAWLAARDTVLLGPWWHRDPRDCVDFGEALDLREIQRAALDQLVEKPIAELLRTEIADIVRPRVAPDPSRRSPVTRPVGSPGAVA